MVFALYESTVGIVATNFYLFNEDGCHVVAYFFFGSTSRVHYDFSKVNIYKNINRQAQDNQLVHSAHI